MSILIILCSGTDSWFAIWTFPEQEWQHSLKAKQNRLEGQMNIDKYRVAVLKNIIELHIKARFYL